MSFRRSPGGTSVALRLQPAGGTERPAPVDSGVRDPGPILDALLAAVVA